jgi:hypothetical protein
MDSNQTAPELRPEPVLAPPSPQPQQSSPTNISIPARKKYAHLYMPLLTSTLICLKPGLLPGMSSNSPQMNILLTFASAIPTFWAASKVYPSNAPAATPAQAIRFTRKHDAYRAVVLFMYGRFFGTPFNLQFLVADFFMSYALGYAIGENPIGTPQRRSEFAVAVCWVAASHVVQLVTGPLGAGVGFWVLVADRAIWRAAYMALVDDVIGVLVWPDYRTFWGRVRVVAVQGVVIVGCVTFALATARRNGWYGLDEGIGEDGAPDALA